MQAGGVIYMATKRYNNKGKQQNRNCWPGNTERMSASAARPTARTSVCATHTHTPLPHTHGESGRRVSRLGNALGQGVSAPRRLKQMMQIRFRCPSAKESRERKAKRKISKNFSWHTGNFYLPAATFATPRLEGRRKEEGQAVAVGS